MIDEDFRFSRGQWRSVVRCLPIPVPADALIQVVLDSAPTASETSDRSALVCSFITPYRELDGQNEIAVLDFETDRWADIDLATATIDFVQRQEHKVSSLRIERIPSALLLRAVIEQQAQIRGITLPPIHWINPASRVKGAKSIRIMRLQELLDHKPPKIQIQWRRNIEMLLDEVSDFVPTEQHRGRQINILDCIALSCHL